MCTPARPSLRAASQLPAAAFPCPLHPLSPPRLFWHTPAQLEAMDPKDVRRIIGSHGLPTSGRPPKLLLRALGLLEGLEAGLTMDQAVAAAKKLR